MNRPTSSENFSCYPQEILNFWADIDTWTKEYGPDESLVSTETSKTFLHHLTKLQPLADHGNDTARYAMASIYLLELIYSNEGMKAKCLTRDKVTMTHLLHQCALNGMVIAFDQLVTSGVGTLGASARLAVKKHKLESRPNPEEANGMPIYSVDWMEGAMNLWLTYQGRENPKD